MGRDRARGPPSVSEVFGKVRFGVAPGPRTSTPCVCRRARRRGALSGSADNTETDSSHVRRGRGAEGQTRFEGRRGGAQRDAQSRRRGPLVDVGKTQAKRGLSVQNLNKGLTNSGVPRSSVDVWVRWSVEA